MNYAYVAAASLNDSKMANSILKDVDSTVQVMMQRREQNVLENWVWPNCGKTLSSMSYTGYRDLSKVKHDR